MKKIGFADFYLSEWHADHYPEMIRAACARTGLSFEAAYAWAMKDVSPVDGRTTDEWCRDMGMEKCETPEELCEKSDCIIILAPSDPDSHLPIAQKIFPCGKRVFMDKTFADSAAAAAEIFALGEKYGTPFFSTSALRYAPELADLEGAKDLIVTVGGPDFGEYIVHPLEIAVSLLPLPDGKVKVEPFGDGRRFCRIVTGQGDEATILFAEGGMKFCVFGKLPDGKSAFRRLATDGYDGLMDDMMRFFETGAIPFDRTQTMNIMRLRDALLAADKTPDEWREI